MIEEIIKTKYDNCWECVVHAQHHLWGRDFPDSVDTQEEINDVRGKFKPVEKHLVEDGDLVIMSEKGDGRLHAGVVVHANMMPGILHWSESSDMVVWTNHRQTEKRGFRSIKYYRQK